MTKVIIFCTHILKIFRNLYTIVHIICISIGFLLIFYNCIIFKANRKDFDTSFVYIFKYIHVTLASLCNFHALSYHFYFVHFVIVYFTLLTDDLVISIITDYQCVTCRRIFQSKDVSFSCFFFVLYFTPITLSWFLFF